MSGFSFEVGTRFTATYNNEDYELELVAIDLKGAVALFDRVLRRTATEDPAFRARLYDWAANRIQLDPSLRGNTLEALLAHEALIAAADTSVELKELFAQLRVPR